MPKNLEQSIQQANIAGVSIATLKKNKVEVQVAGVQQSIENDNNDQELKITPDTRFVAASLSKPVFAYIVLNLIKKGVFNQYGQTIEEIINTPLYTIANFGPPHLQEHSYYKLLTIKNILSHQAGLPNWFYDKDKNKYAEEYTAEPETAFNYSGIAFCFLNDVIESVTKKDLETLAQEVFHDLHLSHSSFFPPEPGVSLAKGHDIAGKTDTQIYDNNDFKPNPAASLLTTAEDYVRFLYACIQDDFIKEWMFKPQHTEFENKDNKAITAGVWPDILKQINWGLGIGLQTLPDGSKIAFHWGDNETHRAFAAINLSTQQAVVCLTNSANGPRIFREIAEPVVGNLSAAAHWLSQREKLTLFTEAKVNNLISNSPGFFKKTDQSRLAPDNQDNSTLSQANDNKPGFNKK